MKPVATIDSIAACNQCNMVIANSLACGKCKITKYCSKSCQVRDWPEHKQWCSRRTLYASARFRLNIITSNFALIHLTTSLLGRFKDTSGHVICDINFTSIGMEGTVLFTSAIAPIKLDCRPVIACTDVGGATFDCIMYSPDEICNINYTRRKISGEIPWSKIEPGTPIYFRANYDSKFYISMNPIEDNKNVVKCYFSQEK